MKNFLLSLALLFISTFAYSQTVEEAAYEAAMDICNCTSDMIGDAHPQMLEYIYNVDAYGQEKAQELFTEYLMTASTEDQQKIMADAERFQNVMSSPEYTNCMEKIDGKYSQFDGESEFLELLQQNLEDLEDCKLTFILMKMGQGEYE